MTLQAEKPGERLRPEGSAFGPARSAPAGEAAATRIGLFGCPPDTGNRGVSALGLSAVQGLLATGRSFDITMFDYGDGARPATVPTSAGDARLTRYGCYYSRRLYRPTNTLQLYWAARAGAARLHPMLRRLSQLGAILDVSGGDSFADLYGPRRYREMALPKLVSLELGVPLILLPQTYGPYRDPRIRATTARILRGAAQVWARDGASLDVVRSLVGSDFDASRHRGGVDMAFGLPQRPPRDPQLLERFERFAERTATLLGFNVSGLLYNRAGDDVRRYGFRDSYRQTVLEIVRRLLADDGGAGVVLLPHVSSGGVDDDVSAIRSLTAELGPAAAERIFTVPSELDATELKWFVGRCAWFCGTRMHACIAGISLGVPTTAVAYSDKTIGVFATADVADCVVDPRHLSGPEVVDAVLSGRDTRRDAAAALARRLPALKRQLAEQFDAISRGIR
jgi:polysaccharide pyruvyl transferase WcaK-like protein